MDLVEYLRLLRRRWRILAACMLVAGVAAWVTTPAEPANDNVTYTATHQLLRDSSTTAPPALATVSLFVKTGDVPISAAERLDFPGEPAVLAAGITLEPDEQVGTLDITTKGGSPEEAAERANVFAEETLALLGGQAAESQREQIERVNETLITLQTEIDQLDDQIAAATFAEESAGTLEATRDSKLRQYGAALDQQQQVLNQPAPSAGYISLQPALPELASVEDGGFAAPTSRIGRTALAAVIGLLLGLGVVLLVERLDTRLHDVDGVSEAFALPIIAEVPRAPTKKSDRRILASFDPMSALAESYRSVRSALVLSPITMLGLARTDRTRTTEDPQVILVTSPAPGDGKTTSVANLAVTMAESGRSVLVLGCDFRRPEIHSYFDVPASPGIAEVLTGSLGQHDLHDIIRPTSVPGVSIAPSGGKLRSFGDVAAVGRVLVEEARDLADVVIIDTPPLLATNDASELIPACDAVVIVSRIGKTTVDSARRTRFLLDRLSAPVSGVVVVGAPEADTRYASYYTDSPASTGRLGGARHVRRGQTAGDDERPVAPTEPRTDRRESPAAPDVVEPTQRPGGDPVRTDEEVVVGGGEDGGPDRLS